MVKPREKSDPIDKEETNDVWNWQAAATKLMVAGARLITAIADLVEARKRKEEEDDE